ncbi:MAG: M81 family metallopeptidase [Alphaproteobacteria bacterium]|nr:M81 family metallopeptidase [Alphaproteobacteria bacterium]MCB9698664.1 M81 family metallopeptidase [Alphaproteobacteria bacterium]
MTGRKRVAFGRINQESNSFSPVRSTVDDFRKTHLIQGPELLARCSRGGTEVEKWLDDAELSGFVRAVEEVGRGRVEAVPLLSAWAIPGGPLTVDALHELIDRMLASLAAAGPVDGVYLALHGALGCDGVPDPEATVLAAIRDRIGPHVPFVVSYDLHGQMTPAKMALVDAAVAYRTNPHRDHLTTGSRAGRLLVRTVLGEIRPKMAWRTLPMAGMGGTTIDLFPTMRPVFRWMNRVEREPGVLDASLFMCHLWNDTQHMGWATVVITDGDQPLAERKVDELSDLAWTVRDVPPPAFPSPAEAIAKVRGSRLRRRLGTACMCDASDIVGCGSTGENTRLLGILLRDAPDLVVYCPLRDGAVVDQLWDHPYDQEVDVVLGGKLDPENCPALPVRGKVTRRHRHTALGRMIVFEVGNASIVLTEEPPLTHKPDFFTDLGLDLWKADIVVVKSLFPFRLYYLRWNRMSLYVRTQGITDLDYFLRQTFDGPIHPQQPLLDWRPRDAERRAARI